MEISPDTQAVVEHLSHSNGNRLRKKNDFAVLLETAATYNLPEEFMNLCFSGKSLWKVYSVLRGTPANHEGYATLRKEMAERLGSLRESLLIFVANMDEEATSRFRSMYLGDDDGVVRNLIDLSFDLGTFKDFQADRKRG